MNLKMTCFDVHCPMQSHLALHLLAASVANGVVLSRPRAIEWPKDAGRASTAAVTAGANDSSKSPALARGGAIA